MFSAYKQKKQTNQNCFLVLHKQFVSVISELNKTVKQEVFNLYKKMSTENNIYINMEQDNAFYKITKEKNKMYLNLLHNVRCRYFNLSFLEVRRQFKINCGAEEDSIIITTFFSCVVFWKGHKPSIFEILA